MKAKEVLLKHCEWSLKNHGKPMIKHREALARF
jgi:hypothetical protein